MTKAEIQVEEYIQSKALAWAPTTITTERSRLRAHIVRLNDSPEAVYTQLSKTMKPYAIKTVFVRLGEFYEWLIKTGKKRSRVNPWKAFMESHALLFKHAYVTEKIEITYEEAEQRIAKIPSAAVRDAAMQMFYGGLRSCELSTFDGTSVVGKGGKRRDVFLPPELACIKAAVEYAELYLELKKVGLKPHTLRKLCASKFGEIPEVNDMDMMERYGWNSIETSKRYRQAKRASHLAALAKKARGE